MNILVMQPGFPAEIPYFVRGLARQGARVIGVGDQPQHALPEPARQGLSAYLHVPKFWDAAHLVQALRQWQIPIKLDRIECLWEAAMELTAEVRKGFGLPGLTPDQTKLFRDKHLMRKALDQAGIRNPRHAAAKTEAEIRDAAEFTGYPLIIKPIAGAGSADTYRVNNSEDLNALLPKLKRISQVVVEEFVHGTEFTFDTICAGGEILFHSIEQYRPDMLTARSVETISPQTVIIKDLDTPIFQRAYRMGRDVIKALGYQTGFTHMEWFLKPDGEVVFGEIAARPPGGFSGQMMNYSCDFDVYNAWAQAIIKGRIEENIERKYNVAIVFKRAAGKGRIQRIEGLENINAKHGDHILQTNLLPIGAQRRNWKQTLISDGYVLLRHPDLKTTFSIADDIAENLNLYAG